MIQIFRLYTRPQQSATQSLCMVWLPADMQCGFSEIPAEENLRENTLG